MSEWIKRSEQEPPPGVRVLLLDYFANDEPEFIDRVFSPSCYPEATHWAPLPAPPPRTVTIEISEEDARAAEKNTRLAPNGYGAYMRRIGDACRRALEGRD